MKNLFFVAFCLLNLTAQAYNEELLFENEQVCISKWKLNPSESVGKHRDENASVIIALQD